MASTPPLQQHPATDGAVRLVAFDLDGTVLDENGSPAPEAMEAARELLQRGVHLASISGRSIRRSLQGLQGYPDVAAAIHVCGYNGAAAIAPERGGRRELLFAVRLAPEALRELAAYAGKRDLNLVYCHCEDTGDGLEEEYRFRWPTGEKLSTIDWEGGGYVLDPDLLERIDSGTYGPPPKMMLFAAAGAQEDTLADLRRRFSGRIYVAWAIPELLEIMSPRVNKGVALKRLAQRLGVDLSQTLAVGDGNNDLPMLQLAGTGLLMSNAADSVRQTAAQIGIRCVPAFAEGGFARAMREHVL
jgi:hydroxymethylpyrimidine pyrophosphatase-like HAD family hydrolase